MFCVCLTYWISQSKVITLSSKDGVQTSLAVSAVWAGHHQRQHTHQHKYCHLHTVQSRDFTSTKTRRCLLYNCHNTNCKSVTAQTLTFATSTLQRNAHMTFPKSNSTMFLKSRAGRANLDTKLPKPFAWLSVMISALQGEMEEIAINTHKSHSGSLLTTFVL